MDIFSQLIHNWTQALAYFSQYSHHQSQHDDSFLKSEVELHTILFDANLCKDADPRIFKLGCFESEVIMEEVTSSAATSIISPAEKQKNNHQAVSNLFSLLQDILMKNPSLYGQNPSFLGLDSFEQNFVHICHFMFIYNRLNLLQNTQDTFSSTQLYPLFYEQSFEDVLTLLHRLIGTKRINQILEGFDASEIVLKNGLDFLLKSKLLWEHFKNVVMHLSNYENNSLFALTFERVEIYNTFGSEVKISLNKFNIKNETPAEKLLTDIQKFVQRSTEKLLDVPYKCTHPLVSFNKLLYFDYIDTEMKRFFKIFILRQPPKGSDTILALIDKATTDGILNYRGLIAKRQKTLELQIRENIGKQKVQSQLQSQLIQNDHRIKQFESQVCTILFLMHRKNRDFYDRAVEQVEIRIN